MDEKTIKHLTTPFAKDQLKVRRGGRKGDMTYVEGALVVERLNLAFGHRWSWQVLDSEVRDAGEDRNGKPQYDVTVRGRLTVDDDGLTIIKDAFGGVRVGAAGKGECHGDDLKGAATDALKKAASLLGVGLHLYSDEVDTGEEPARVQEPRRERTQAAKPDASKAANGPGRVTDEQLALMRSLGRQAGVEEEAIRARCLEEYGAQPELVTQAQADEVIGRLRKRASERSGPPDGSRLSERQLNAIMAIGRTLGWTADALRQRSMDIYGVPPNELSKADASAFIGELQQQAVKAGDA